MSVQVKVPTQLRTLTDGASEVSGTGGDVGSLIKDLDARHPGLGERLLDDSGQLRRFVNVYVNDEEIAAFMATMARIISNLEADAKV
jgi:molybdopterin synthase sulfur carrier subunit